MSTASRRRAFDAIHKNGNGNIEFKEFYKHFGKENSTWTVKELLILYRRYEGDSKGINFEEYNSFMDSIHGKSY